MHLSLAIPNLQPSPWPNALRTHTVPGHSEADDIRHLIGQVETYSTLVHVKLQRDEIYKHGQDPIRDLHPFEY
jgi:hypothetical protein